MDITTKNNYGSSNEILYVSRDRLLTVSKTLFLRTSGYVLAQRNSKLAELPEPMQHWKCPILKKWPPRGHGSHCFALYILFSPWTFVRYTWQCADVDARRIANFTPKTNHPGPVIRCLTLRLSRLLAGMHTSRMRGASFCILPTIVSRVTRNLIFMVDILTNSDS